MFSKVYTEIIAVNNYFVNRKIKNISVEHIFKGDEDRGLQITCEVILSYGNHIPTLVQQTQANIREAVEFTTGMIVHAININVKALYVDSQLLR